MMKRLIITLLVITAAFAVKAQQVKPDTSHVPVIAFVNQDSLLDNYEYFKTIKAKMQTLSQKAQDEITAKGQAFQKEVAAYQKSANALKPTQKAAAEKRLAAEQQQLQNMQQNTGKQLQDIENSENATLYDKIAAYLKTYCKAKGYKIILTYSKSNPSMLYGDDSLDITREVVAGLNAEYKAGK
ncbi:MAG TPA: OmpH family outer membrane protein [Mucilaginibacter sp.]|jgi:outer membrane protein|nr:OmpH family outer membrane protein [Mucilaginibacter sp.]